MAGEQERLRSAAWGQAVRDFSILGATSGNGAEILRTNLSEFCAAAPGTLPWRSICGRSFVGTAARETKRTLSDSVACWNLPAKANNNRNSICGRTIYELIVVIQLLAEAG